LLAAPLLAPFLEAMPQSQRFHEQKAKPFDAIPYSDRASLVLLLEPKFYGPRPVPWGPAYLESITGFASILGIAALVALLVHIAINRTWRSRELLFAIGWLIGFAVIADWSPISEPIKWLIPFTAHARFRLFLCWFGAVQIAAMLHLVRERAAIIAGVVATALPLALAIATTNFPSDAAKHATLIAAIPGAIALLLALFRWRVVIVVALFLELWFAGHNWNPVFPAKTLYPRTPLITALDKLDHGERIVGIGGALFPNTNAIFGFADVRVHDPMANARYIDMLRRDAHYDTGTYYAKWNDADTPLLNTLNVRWIVTEPGRDVARHRLAYDGTDGRIYENVNASKVRFENPRSDRSFWIGTIVCLLTLVVMWSAAAMPPLWVTRRARIS
ncbi:MAG TPA: hypothetical protein VMU84_14750, partial [Thermoanaerobaculia bacterium]|nr:hypothetical protein [Thermoanaerobaculia bacterium]